MDDGVGSGARAAEGKKRSLALSFDGEPADTGPTCGQCASRRAALNSRILRCRNPRSPRVMMCVSADTAACQHFAVHEQLDLIPEAPHAA